MSEPDPPQSVRLQAPTPVAGQPAATPPTVTPAAGESLAGMSLAGVTLSGSAAGSAAPAAADPAKPAGGGRQTFGLEELALVLSRYDLGPLDSVLEYPHGSRKAPKLLLQQFVVSDDNTDAEVDDEAELERALAATAPDSGLDLAAPEGESEPHGGPSRRWLLKRRARSRGGDPRVAFCHAVQRHLAAHRFPIAPLVLNREDDTVTAVGPHRYELFEFIHGNTYDQSLAATSQSGRMLAVFHQLMKHFGYEAAGFDPPTNGYHRAAVVAQSFLRLPSTVQQTDADVDRIALGKRSQFLQESYLAAADAADAAGLASWPTQVVHADWHPGNTLFMGQRVTAIIDFDSARVQARALDVANAALQFSIIGGGDDPTQWPAYLDENRFKRFIRGYDAVPNAVLSRAELRILPHLMIEALIAESVIPIALSGKFGRTPGAPFLTMIERKVRWLQEHTDPLFRALDV